MSRRTPTRRSSLFGRFNPFARASVDRSLEFKRSRRPQIELLEDRRLLAIVWANRGDMVTDSDSFNAVYGAMAEAARANIDRAIADWNAVITDFNYDGDNDPTTDNGFVLTVVAADLGGGSRGRANNIMADGNMLPISATVTMDDAGGNGGWFIDPTPLDDEEFTALVTPFTANSTQAGNDFYRTAVHEIGHAVGILLGNGLAINNFLTPAGIDQVTDPADPPEALQVFQNLAGQFGVAVTLTENGGGHIYEGPADPAFPSAPTFTNDLMNSGRTVGPPATRQIISDLNAMLLADAYGYTVVLPSTLGAVFVAPDNLEPNNTRATATVLGSAPYVTLTDLSIDSASDEDWFRYTAHQSGKLVINALFDDIAGDGLGNIDIFVFDSSGNQLAAATSTDSDERIILPVVHQESYFIRVVGVDDDINNYRLEVENFAAPIPSNVSLSPGSDTGASNSDNVTADNTPTFFIQNDLATFAVPTTPGTFIGAIDAAPGYDTELVITNLATGDETIVNAARVGTSRVWNATAPMLPDGEYLVAARTRVDDNYVAGGPNTGFSLLSVPIFVTIDAVPDEAIGTIELVDSSDTGMDLNDNVINIQQPAFTGSGPVNQTVRVFAQRIDAVTQAPLGAVQLVGIGTVGSENTFGTPDDGLGLWEITVEPLADGLYNIFAQFEDGAGNISEPVRMASDTFVEAANLAINDQSTVVSSLDLTGQNLAVAQTVAVTLNIDHTAVGDLEITLIAPTGERILLVDNRGGTGENFTGTVLSDFAVDPIAGVVFTDAPFTGTFAAEVSIAAAINGINPAGVWQLEVVDNLGLDDGTLVSWSLDFTEALVVDTVAPNTPFLDLTTDTGRSSVDNITSANRPTFTLTGNAVTNPQGVVPPNTNPFSNDVKFRLYLRPDGNLSVPEQLVYDSFADLGGFTTLAQIQQQISLILNDPNGLALPDGVHDFKLEVEDRAGNISEDFILSVTIDTTAPPVSFGLPGSAVDGLLGSSDTGVVADPPTLTDRITADSTPTFWGLAEANSVVRLFIDIDGNGIVDGDDRLVGQTVATPYDGNLAFADGYWEITTNIDLNDPALFATRDGLRNLLVTAEDVAGNTNTADDMQDDALQALDIFLDTQGPQVAGVFVAGDRDYDLLDPKPSEDGYTPLITSIDIDFIDQPVRGEAGMAMATGFIDLIVVMDESGSMSGEQAFIGGFIQTLDAALVAAGIGAGVDTNQFGLVGYGNGINGIADLGRTILVGGGLFGTDDQFAAATSNLVISGSFEDGYSGVDFALQNYAFRPGSTPIIVLVTDEDRDNGNAALNSATFVADMMGAGASLVSIVDASLQTSTAATALAIDSLMNAYVEQPGGAFAVSPGGVVVSGDGNTVADYINTAFMLDGFAADLNQLRNGGNSADSFSAALLNGILGIAGGGGFVYPAVNEVISTIAGRYQLVGDRVGPIAITPGMIEFIDSTVAGDIGRTTIRLNFTQPLPDDRYTLTIVDSLTDDPGNRLDGESNASEPLDNVTFPSGDGVPGGNFVARFTVDSRPEIGTYIPTAIGIDINGNFAWDPNASDLGGDATNLDISFTMDLANDAPGGFASHDQVFAGRFVANGAVAPPNIFDQLAVYGYSYETGEHRWLVDFNSDGVVDPAVGEIYAAQPNLAAFGLNTTGAVPIAGNFDGDLTNGDEIGLYHNGNWGFDFNRNFVIDPGELVLNTGLLGMPIVGDFDGNGFDDVAVYRNDAFTFAFSTGAFGNFTSTAVLNWGFPGVLDRPIAADMNADGIDDIGLWVPRNSIQDPQARSEWYFLVSDPGAPGAAAGPLSQFYESFSPPPFAGGNDIYANFGDQLAMPIVGNFDPPVASTSADSGTNPGGGTGSNDPTTEPNTVDPPLAGDYDGNGYVDFGDRLVWRAAFGTTGTGLAADGNGDGRVDSADYTVWRDNLGTGIMPASLAATLAGDYNNDGIVDGDDHLVWRGMFGATGYGLAADGNQDGIVDSADYAVWRDNRDSAAMIAAASSTVPPQPSTSGSSATFAASTATPSLARPVGFMPVAPAIDAPSTTSFARGTSVSNAAVDEALAAVADSLLLVGSATRVDDRSLDSSGEFDLFDVVAHEAENKPTDTVDYALDFANHWMAPIQKRRAR